MIADQPFAIPSAALAVVALPLALNAVPRNRFYGFRTARTLADDAAWYRANRVAGWGLVVSTGVYAAVATASPYAGTPTSWALHLAAFVGPILVALVVARRALGPGRR
jgi:uncharacterized membrane protein